MSNAILVAKKSIRTQLEALEYLRARISIFQSSYNEVMDILRRPGLSNYKNRIIITGVGKNAHIAAKASETFASLGIPSMYLNTGHYSHGDAGFIAPADVVIHISRSGKTEEMINASKHLRIIRPGVSQILLHCNSSLSENTLKLFNTSFCAGDVIESDENGLAPTTSTTVLLALIDTFAINLSSERKFTSDDFLKYHPGGSLGEQLRASK
ncbi:arabinose 5-phosphate isomerase [Pectobacterium bacteriophage PM2]|uniref:SIS domain-containing protein n=1 Tax=Pectobacterium bacteriophage PM2 TaxID=1429794 RepID=A0A0A0Q3B9_9CAUD|nr:arabinose 5-phosphate isomerase [Pectobacterium bacteriophage PM2]AHY25012.1 hypothetical protein PM2_050 [Pectobacterium bacteriophage PM2]